VEFDIHGWFGSQLGSFTDCIQVEILLSRNVRDWTYVTMGSNGYDYITLDIDEPIVICKAETEDPPDPPTIIHLRCVPKE
jgi:hypothetical protein